MKVVASILGLAALARTVSAHYTFGELIHNSKVSEGPVREPLSYLAVETEKQIASVDVRCNVNPSPAKEVETVRPGDLIGFQITPSRSTADYIYHEGPGFLYIAKAPGNVTNWDGDGAQWIKIADWGATFNPFSFKLSGTHATNMTTTLPNVPNGEYLFRVEQIGVHIKGDAQFYVSCAQIKVVGGSGTLPAGVKIPGHLTGKEPSLDLNIWVDEIPYPTLKNLTSYDLPPPAVWRGN